MSAMNIQADLRDENTSTKSAHICIEADKHKLKKTDGKVMAACLVRDLFGSILYHQVYRKVPLLDHYYLFYT